MAIKEVEMDEYPDLGQTRRSLHGIGEGIIAGPQYREFGTIRLRVTPGGFGGVRTVWRVDGLELTDGSKRLPLTETFGGLAAAAGVEFGPPQGLYHDHSGCGPDEPVVIDPADALRVTSAFGLGDEALRTFAPQEEPVLWPEHFDVSITVDEVNYGVSPGDAAMPMPYAYIGPLRLPEGEFWNAAFGAARYLDELGGTDAVVAFFAEGARLAGEARS